MFSFSKLLVLAGIILAVIAFFKVVGNLDKIRKTAEKARDRVTREPETDDGVEDLVKCRVCDTFVAARGAKSCGRADCPYG
ncbi:MAG: hypothetical protein NXI16_16205 [Alphaproteobacteria bacterium]|nr:hypothetical protein [Alphaproteobacteria bacterium]